MADTTGRCKALQTSDDVLSERIMERSRKSRRFHQDLRRRMSETPPASAIPTPDLAAET